MNIPEFKKKINAEIEKLPVQLKIDKLQYVVKIFK